MKPLALAFLLLCVTNGVSAQTYLTVPGISYHTDRELASNEHNIGVGIEHGISADAGLICGYYRNSFSRNAWYIGGIWRPLQTRHLRAGVITALATGYPSPIIVLPTINLGTEAISIDVFGSPSMGKHTGTFVAAQLRIRVW